MSGWAGHIEPVKGTRLPKDRPGHFSSQAFSGEDREEDREFSSQVRPNMRHKLVCLQYVRRNGMGPWQN